MKKTCLILMAALAALALPGCGEDAAAELAGGEVHLAVVLGSHANAPIPAVGAEDVEDLVLAGCQSYGSVVLIVDDGEPYVAADYQISPPDRELSAGKKEQLAKAQSAQVLDVLRTSAAKTAEADPLSALTLAGRGLAGAQGSRELVVLDSGLGTAGYLDFTLGLLRADPDAVVEYLEQCSALPDLTGVHVTWVGLGDVAAPQQKLPASNAENLRAIWEKILLAAGATVDFSMDLPASAEMPDLPYVTPVEIIPDAPINLEEISRAVGTMSEGPVILDEKTVLFLPDTAVFADKKAAQRALVPLAEQMAADADLRIVLAGTTATAGTSENCRKFSLTRATAVKELLCDMGVPADQITAVLGLGYENKWHLPDLSADGNLNANAPKNRSVIILDAASEDARQLLGS
ncbi:MAG TPA: OmpA family protein [Candidatus Acidoferrum sp.]|nr:OmpA family protein [Candidatus Acidoferrum sp.]